MKLPDHHTPQVPEEQVLPSLRSSRIIWPILIGASAVAYVWWDQFDHDEFSGIAWSHHVAIWTGIAVVLAMLRHVAFAARLRALSHGAFPWMKSIELMFLWEFASCVSPTSLGGSLAALFMLAKEKLPTAKTTTIVLYTIVLDGIFLTLTLPLLFAVFGVGIMRPGAESFADTSVWGVYFVLAYLAMLVYDGLLAYGLFYGAPQMKRFLHWVTGLPMMRKFRMKADTLGDELIVASAELRQEPWSYHLEALVHTFVAWISRFLLLSALIIAFVPSLPLQFWPQFELYARLETMFFVIAFSPTPGGAGLIELVFNGFLSDYVTSSTTATVIGTSWRMISYYVYLVVGAVIIPLWVRRIRHKQ